MQQFIGRPAQLAPRRVASGLATRPARPRGWTMLPPALLIALLAAIFSSEFLAPALRTRVKTLIEFMASLPSVVLGFLAALVFAPFVQ